MDITQNKIKVLAADDSAVWNRMLISYIEANPEIELAGEVNSSVGCIIVAEEASPDVVVLGYDRKASMEPKEIIRQLRAILPEVKVILCADQIDKASIENTIGRGMDEFAIKPYNSQQIIRLIKRSVGLGK